MNTPLSSLLRKAASVFSLSLLALAASSQGSVTINFDNIAEGPQPPEFLAAYGIPTVTFSGAPGAGGPRIYDFSTDPNNTVPSSPNLLVQDASALDTNEEDVLTFQFDPPLNAFSLDRVGKNGGGSTDTWHADFYNANGDLIGTFGEGTPLVDAPVKTFTSTAPVGEKIASMKLVSVWTAFATHRNIPVDNFVLYVDDAPVVPGPPTVMTNAATEITPTTAKFNATVNPHFVSTTVYFYLDGGYYGQVNAGAGGDPITVSLDASGFTPGSEHYYYAYATSTEGNATGDFVFFTLAGGAPTLTTDNPTDVTINTATLNATVNPHLVSSTVYFYVDGIFYGQASAGDGNTAVPVSIPVSGFTPGSIHTVQAYVSNDYFGFYSDNTANLTLLGGSPTIVTDAPTNVTINSATLNATVNPNLVASTVYFYVDGYPYGQVDAGAGETNVSVNIAVSDFTPGSTHSVQAYVSNTYFGLYSLNTAPLTFLGGAPTITTDAATNVTINTATLNATVNPNLVDSVVYFYVDGYYYGQASAGAGNSPVAVNLPVSGFTPGSSHTVQTYVSNNYFGNYSENTVPLNFLGGVPSITTLTPSDRTGTSATLRASLDPNLVDTVVYFFLDGSFAGQVSVTGDTPPGEVTLPVSGLTDGQHYTTQSYAYNAAGSTDGGSIQFVSHNASQLTQTILYTGASKGAGSPVPGQPGGYFTKFGIPAINDESQTAFIANYWTSTGSLSGIFDGIGMLVQKGDAAPDLSGATLGGFKDPAINEFGAVAFLASLKGSVASGMNQGLFSNFSGIPQLVQQKGAAAPQIPGATLNTIGASVMTSEGIFFSGKLGGTVTDDDDSALWYWTPSGGSELKLREGQTLDSKTVKLFAALKSASGSAGHGRSARGDEALVRVTFTDGTQEIITDCEGITQLAVSGDPAPDLPGVTLAKFGLPIMSENGGIAYHANLKGGSSGGNKAIFATIGGEPHRIFGKGDVAPGLSGITYSAFKDPLYNANEAVLALTTLAGDTLTGANKTALVYKAPSSSVQIVARAGDQATDAPPGAKWRVFKSVALPDGLGPIFIATMQFGSGSVDATNDLGLWAQDGGGVLHLIVREGDVISGKTVKTFTVLKAVGGSSDQTRSFNVLGQIVYRVAFTDGTSAIIRADIPQDSGDGGVGEVGGGGIGGVGGLGGGGL